MHPLIALSMLRYGFARLEARNVLDLRAFAHEILPAIECLEQHHQPPIPDDSAPVPQEPPTRPDGMLAEVRAVRAELRRSTDPGLGAVGVRPLPKVLPAVSCPAPRPVAPPLFLPGVRRPPPDFDGK